MDEVGPNDPHRGRSSIGGFKMPGSVPIPVRDIEDIRDAGWGGMRKPKGKDDATRDTSRPDLAGGGYTPSQTNNDRGKFFLLFLGGPVALLAIVGFLGWLTSQPVEPVSSVCDKTGYEATYLRSDFHEDARTAEFWVALEDEINGRNTQIVEIRLPTDPDALVAVEAKTQFTQPVTTCAVTKIELAE